MMGRPFPYQQTLQYFENHSWLQLFRATIKQAGSRDFQDGVEVAQLQRKQCGYEPGIARIHRTASCASALVEATFKVIPWGLSGFMRLSQLQIAPLEQQLYGGVSKGTTAGCIPRFLPGESPSPVGFKRFESGQYLRSRACTQFVQAGARPRRGWIVV